MLYGSNLSMVAAFLVGMGFMRIAMKLLLVLMLLSTVSHATVELPSSYKELLDFVQPAPFQAETNTCLFIASTGAMELLMNKRDGLKNPQVNGKNDLSESFLIWQKNFYDNRYPVYHFIQQPVMNFNYGEAILNRDWPFVGENSDGTTNYTVWNKHPEYYTLPRVKTPLVKTTHLFTRGKKWATRVILPEDITTIKQALVKNHAPVIINYVDDGYWHVVLIVGYDDNEEGECYLVEDPTECDPKGIFYVRDSFGRTYADRWDTRAYSWFKVTANAASQIQLQ